MKIKQLAQILQVLIEAGHADGFVQAEHDELFLLPPGTIYPDSVYGEILKKNGVQYSNQNGWMIFT